MIASLRPAACRSWIAAVCGVAAFAFASRPAPADDVSRTGGQVTVRGEVQDVTRAGVTVKEVEGTEVEVPAAEIAEISWDGEPANMGTLRSREARGQLVDALTGYRDALPRMSGLDAEARADTQFLIARTLAKLALNDPDRREEAVEALNDFISANPQHYRVDPARRWLADVQAAAGDSEAAAKTLQELKSSPSPAFQTVAAISEAKLALQRGDADEALATFDSVLQNADGRVAAEAKIGRAAALGRLNRHSDALTTLDEVLAAVDPDDAQVRAQVHLRRGDSLLATGDQMPAIIEYLKVDVLYPGASAAHAESLYHLSRQWAAVGSPERAAEAAAKLKANYPNSEWAAKLSAG